jgi:hypothetical protein
MNPLHRHFASNTFQCDKTVRLLRESTSIVLLDGVLLSEIPSCGMKCSTGLTLTDCLA